MLRKVSFDWKFKKNLKELFIRCINIMSEEEPNKIVERKNREKPVDETPLEPISSLSKKDSGEKTSVLKQILIEFSDASTIHGVKYIGARPLHEK